MAAEEPKRKICGFIFDLVKILPGAFGHLKTFSTIRPENTCMFSCYSWRRLQ